MVPLFLVSHSLCAQLSTLLESHETDAALDQALQALASEQGLDWAARLSALAKGPEPREAISRLLLLPERIWERPWPAQFDPLFHQGSYPARLLGIYLREPKSQLEDLLEATSTALRFPSRDELLHEMQGQLQAGVSLGKVLGRVRTREYLRIIRGEYEQAPLESICSALSELAAACVQLALSACAPELAELVVVFGMGKLGGDELNFLSDIDLIFFHHEDAIDQRDEGTAHRSRNRLFGQLRRVLRALEGESPYRPLFRVDLRLRPFGSRGPLSMSLQAAEGYFERYGRDWERQAWLRAKPIAGKLELGEQLLRRLSPFVYRRSTSPAIFAEISEVMQRAHGQARPFEPEEHAEFDLKLDRGGIREVEFFVQALQLLHAGKHPMLISPSTLRGLDRLASQGFISDREHQVLDSAYRYFRQLEHRVQLGEGQQSHAWPVEDQARALVLRRVQGSAWSQALDLEAEDQIISAHRQAVMSVSATLNPEQAPPKALDSPQAQHELALSQACDAGARSTLRRRAMAQLGLLGPEDAAALVEHLCSRRGSAFCEPGPGRPGAFALLRACLESADPDRALQRLAAFAGRAPAHFAIWRIFADPQHQELLRQLADLFGVSDPLSQGLISSRGLGSGGGIVSLLQDARATGLPTRLQMLESMQRYESKALHAQEIEGFVDELLRFKHAELLKIGLVDLGHRPGPAPVGRALSDLADLIVRSLLRHLAAIAPQGTQEPPPAPITIAVFALGKYGMQAMDYGSDLDLMFVFSSESSDPELGVWATRLVNRLTNRLQSLHHGGRLYEVDTRLRPSGRSGLLVSSLAAFRRYHAQVLPVWERLAMLRARGVAELVMQPEHRSYEPSALPGALCREITQSILRESSSRGPSTLPELLREIHPLKLRIEEELARESDTQWDLKSGQGGCMDFEFLISALQISQGNYGAGQQDFFALAQSFEDTHIPAGLCRAYQFQRQVLNRLRLSVGAGRSGEQDRLHLESPRLGALSRRMGMSDAQALIRALREARTQIRSAFLNNPVA